MMLTHHNGCMPLHLLNVKAFPLYCRNTGALSALLDWNIIGKYCTTGIKVNASIGREHFEMGARSSVVG
jgi:hypothetical protein